MSWTHCGQTVDDGGACPKCRAKWLRLWIAPGEDVKTDLPRVLQHGKEPPIRGGAVFRVLADPPYRAKAAEVLRLSLSRIPSADTDPTGFGLVTRAKTRVLEE